MENMESMRRETSLKNVKSLRKWRAARVGRFTFAAVAVLSALVISATSAPQRGTTSRTEGHVEVLASEALEGRLTGTIGAQRAADYIIDELRKIGAEPLPGRDDLRIPFEFTAGVSDGGSSLTMLTVPTTTAAGDHPRRWEETGSVRALSFSDVAEVRGPVVFAGYGLSVPETDGFSYDSFATVDVTDKIVLMLRYYPEDVDQETRNMLSRHAALRYKAFAARERGAKALLVVAGPRSPNAGEIIPMSFDAAMSSSGIVAASISGEVADAMFEHVPDTTLEEAQAALDTGNPHVAGFEIPGIELTLDVKVNREARTGYSVVGYLPPRPVSGTVAPKPYVMLGAHYDHLGRGGHGNSLAKKEEAGQIHYGADDNASGVAAVLVAGALLSEMSRARGVVLALWSGEELGLLGSADFVKQQPIPMDQVAAYLNFDMVGRMRDGKLTVQAVGTSEIWPELVEETNTAFGFNLSLMSDPYLPTDIMSINQASVPSLGFFTGSHEYYHRPTDVPSTINFDELDRIAQFAARVGEQIANMPEPPGFIKVDQAVQPGGRTTLRIFTGTIPDYATEVDGLRLSGVIGGGPADRAGLLEGDVIVELAGQKIANIYDYMYALDALKVGEPADVVLLRDGERQETTLVPEARQ